MGLWDQLRNAGSRMFGGASGSLLDDAVQKGADSEGAGYIGTRSSVQPDDRTPKPQYGAPLVDPKSLFWDPFSLVEQLGYKEKPTAVTYGTLQMMTWKVPIVQAIIQTRLNQASTFCTPQVHKFDPGFRIKMRDPEARPTRADKKFARQLEAQIMSSGAQSDARYHDSFETFVRKILRDSLVYDQMCFEILRGRDGRPSRWMAVDAATIRRADTRKLYPSEDPSDVRYVQIYDNTVIAEYTAEELAFGVRNPRTDIRAQQYGTAELEMLVSTVTSILYAWNYNQNFFSQGTVAKGVLNIVGSMPEHQLRAFRRLWYQQISGVENAWRTPITNAEKLEWINLQQSNRDMEFSAWMDFLIKVTCAIFQMDPIEVNFKYGTGGARSMFDTGNRAKATESRDRGLRPLLRFVAREMDKHIIWPIDPNFTIEFVGLESQTPKELADLNTQRVRTMYTINEVRAENDLMPLPNGDGDVILDTNWLAARRERMAAEQRKQEQAQAAAQAAAQATGVTDAHLMPGATPVDQAVEQVKPQAGGAAPGAIPGKGSTPPSSPGAPTGAAPQGPDKDQIAELEGLLNPAHSGQIDKSLKNTDDVRPIWTIDVEL